MFNGEHNHTVDPKGRLIIPSKFREELGEQFKMTRGLDGCLFLFPMSEWHIHEEKLKKLPLADKNARKFSRFFTAGATTCEIDKQGRVLVPSTLREFAKIEKEVESRYSNYRENLTVKDVKEIMEDVFDQVERDDD